ncbi:hypothetical protein JKP88DRAFT_255346 [Tribonema minus]|uniref:Uncharacterized protein n=1 Tax=Tribonema minus TaxID=303371 RepID=A0A836CGT2_9STRA|nr:hypothetical protein JKP88DRAFT_255346 [Tribonema minus]
MFKPSLGTQRHHQQCAAAGRSVFLRSFTNKGAPRLTSLLSTDVRTPRALKIIELENWAMDSWEPIQLLLSPVVATLRFINCSFEFEVPEGRILMTPLPEQLFALELENCFAEGQLIFERLPLTLRRVSIMSSGIEAVFTHGLPSSLKSFALGNLYGDQSIDISAEMLPESLEEPTLVGCDQLESLPPRLRVLRMSEYGRQLPTLPDTLEALELDNRRHDVVQYPDRLRSLSLSWNPVMAPPWLPTSGPFF